MQIALETYMLIVQAVSLPLFAIVCFPSHCHLHNMCLQCSDWFPDMLVVDHYPKFTSQVFWAFVKSMGLCLILSSAYHKSTNPKVELANGVISDMLHAYANGRKDDWDRQLPLAVFAINNPASTLGDRRTPFSIDSCANPRLQLSAPAVKGS